MALKETFSLTMNVIIIYIFSTKTKHFVGIKWRTNIPKCAKKHSLYRTNVLKAIILCVKMTTKHTLND